MSVELKFTGTYLFESERLLAETLKEITDFLKVEDPAVAENWADAHHNTATKIEISLHVGATEDDYMNYESIVEILASNAKEGQVLAWRDDYEEGEIEIYDAAEIDYSLEY